MPQRESDSSRKYHHYSDTLLATMRGEHAAKLEDAMSERRTLARSLSTTQIGESREPNGSSRIWPIVMRRRNAAGFLDCLEAAFVSRTRSLVFHKKLEASGSSVYFDEEFYLEQNPDVRAAGLNAALHYLLNGTKEGRDPGPFFSTSQYLAQFPDIAAARINAFSTMKYTAALKKSDCRVVAGCAVCEVPHFSSSPGSSRKRGTARDVLSRVRSPRRRFTVAP
jgi:hypothetical protein